MFSIFKKSSGVSWIVVFLGNPGSEYAGSRHNIGFMTADACESKTGASIKRLRFKALTDTVKVGDETVLLMKPQTYMNNSGEAVGEAARFYKVPAEHVIVISDDISLPVGKLRVRAKGSAGGHNGLKSIISHLGTDAFPRIKVGVGAPPHPDYSMPDWVLGSFHGDDARVIAETVKKAWDAVESYILAGCDRTMNKYN